MKGAQTLFGLSYSYGSAGSNNGQITGITDNVDSGRTASYAYDALYRLKTAVTTGSGAYPAWGLSWTYDRYANRTAQTVTAGTAPSNSVTIDATTNRITGTGYSYDANGNMTADGMNALTYDGENRVVTSSGSSYTYDGNNLRVKKVSGGTTTVYVFSGAKVIAEYVNGAAPGSPTKEYIYSGSALLATIAGSTTTYHHADHLSARVTTDSNGNLAGQQGHFAFGESWYAASVTTKWQFTGYERDAESGNDYAMFRYYVNRLGRFNAPDPIAGSTADPQSLNRYAYTLNDPVNLNDPLGLWPLADLPDFDPGSADSKSIFAWLRSQQVGYCPAEFSFCIGTPSGIIGFNGTNGVVCKDVSGGNGEPVKLECEDEVELNLSDAAGGAAQGGGPIDKARDKARALLSDPDCAKFLKGLLSKLGFLPNLDNFLALFDQLTIVPTAAGDEGVGYPTTAHVDVVNAGSTVHVDVPSSPSLPQVLLHETFHTLGFGVYEYGLAVAATGRGVVPRPGVSQIQANQANSRAASAAFNQNCKPK